MADAHKPALLKKYPRKTESEILGFVNNLLLVWNKPLWHYPGRKHFKLGFLYKWETDLEGRI